MANYKIKNVGAYFCLFGNLAYHSHTDKQTEKHPRKEYNDTPVMCALRPHVPRRTLRRVYDTPRGNYPCIVSDLYSSVVVRLPKNKASVTPFNM